MPRDNNLLPPAYVARQLGISTRHVRRLAAAGWIERQDVRVKGKKIARWRITRASFEKYREMQKKSRQTPR